MVDEPPPIVWAPQPGSQTAFLACPLFEVIYEGSRGPGKTDALLMDFAADTNQGLGPDWRGIIFRRSHPELADIIAKSKKWFSQFKNAPKFNEAKSTWTWPDGEQLLLRHMLRPDDYWSYHGHQYPWQGWEELTTWPNDECFLRMMSCARSSNPKVAPRARIRSTANPYGAGHNWVKARYRLPQYRGKPIVNSLASDGELEPPRMAIHGHISENKILLEADPKYISRLRASARNEEELKAWLDGSWDIVAGGMFDDVWDKDTNVVPNFPASMVPSGWRIDRALDWGSSTPFSVGWWLESNGEPIEYEGKVIGAIRGDLIRYMEWYGFTGRRNEGVKMLPGEVAVGILDRESDHELTGRVRTGPADHNIFTNDSGPTAESLMREKGIYWDRADKGPGSRKAGWEVMRQRMAQTRPSRGEATREKPGLFVCERCDQFQLTVPNLSRLDRDLDDIDTESEDHIADETRYRVRRADLTVHRKVQ